VILVIQEIFGVHEYIADTCRRFAKLGYLAIAPELYARQGDPRGYTDIPKLQADIVSKVPDAQVMADLDGALPMPRPTAATPARPASPASAGAGASCGCMPPPARSRPAWPGTAGWSGRPATAPKHPIDIAASLQAPVLGLYGGKDQGIPLDTVDKMKAALANGTAAAKASSFVVYPEAGHAFHADYRPSYVKSAADDGWQRATAWFKANGVA
jgi:carboxymethylenebutenolidase